MKRVLFIGLILFLIVGMVAFAGGGRQTEERSRLHLATGGTTGTYFPLGTAMAQIIMENTGMQVIVQATGASRANIQLIDAGENQLAMVQNDVAEYAWTGADFFQGTRYQTFNGVASLYPEPIQLIASVSSGIRTVSDLRGRNVSIGDVGSGTEFNSRHILAAAGVGLNEIGVQNLGFGASADALRDGRIEAFFTTAGLPTAAIIDLATTRDIVIVPVDGALASAIMRDHPFYTTLTIPANTYRGQTSAVTTVTIKAVLIAATSVSEEAVYQLTKSLFENQPRLAAAHARGNDLNLTDAVEGMGQVPFHPGALRFYREVGAIR